MQCYKIHHRDGALETESLKLTEATEGLVTKYVLDGEIDFKDVSAVEFCLHEEEICAGDEGFYLLPGWPGNAVPDNAIGYFHEREDVDITSNWTYLPIFGICHGGKCYLYITTGMAAESRIRIIIKDNKYTFLLRFTAENYKNYEPFSFERHELKGADMTYGGMAREYRKYKLQNGFASIRDRLDDNLKYTTESMLVRIRMGWKPVPTKIANQTLENEPPMHIACTFAQVEKIMESYYKAGIKKVEFSLVGWNIRGHDGRWPQILPADPDLGGEEGLKRLIATAKRLGFALTCHTNSTDAYSIAENFSEDDIIRRADGSLDILCTRWAGGSTYNICPTSALRLAKETLPAVKELGFGVNHYIDVITCVKPRTCYSDKHPVNSKQCTKLWNELFEYAHTLFGGASCEGPSDYYLKHIDYVLYVSFYNNEKHKLNPIIDEFVPFWQLVFHGIVLSNPFARTINASLSSTPNDLLKLVEYGARPSLYYYSKFVDDGSNWISDTDFTANNDKDIERCTAAAKELYDKMSEFTHLQYEFMENHEKIADGVYKITYSDGSVITVDYNEKKYALIKNT